MSEFDSLRTSSELSLLRSQIAALRANQEGLTMSRRPSDRAGTPVPSVPEERETESARSSHSNNRSTATSPVQGAGRGVIDIYLDVSSAANSQAASQKARRRNLDEELTLTKSKSLPFPPAFADAPKDSPKNTLFPPFIPGKPARRSSGIKKKRNCIVQ